MPMDPQKLAAFVNAKKPPHAAAADDDSEGNDADTGEGDKEVAEGEGGEDEEKDVDAAAIGEQVQSGKGDKKLLKLCDGMSNDMSDEDAPAWALDSETWHEAHELVEPKWDEYDLPHAVVAHVYKELGGAIEEGGETE